MMDQYSIYPKQFNSKGTTIQSDSCFVIMPFSEDLNNTYMVIDSVASTMDIKCTRADNISTTSAPILNKICTQISQAYYIIVDITNLNPNVFYELGIAHVLRDASKVLIVKEDGTNCPSDIKHLHYYSYSKANLVELKKVIENFFTDNNILEDLHSVLRFLGLLPSDIIISKEFVLSISDHIGNHLECLIMILNDRIADVTQNQAEELLGRLTAALNTNNMSEKIRSLYSALILFLIMKMFESFDISGYIDKMLSGKYYSFSDEWLADSCICIFESPKYFDKAITWIINYLKTSSPAAFDIAKYKIEIGIIKSKSLNIDAVLIEQLKSDNKTLVEHCAKLIKERRSYAAIPILTDLVLHDENPYVVRSSLDALTNMAPLATLLSIKKGIMMRKDMLEKYHFISGHIQDLDCQIAFLQDAANR